MRLESSNQPDVAQLMEQIRNRVEERRRAGEYPPGLEEEFAAHFERIVKHRSRYFFPLRDRLNALRESMGFDPRRITTVSKRPGGALVHRIVGRFVARQSQGVLEQVRVFAEAVSSALEGVVEVLEQPGTLNPGLVGQVDAILERLAAYERALGNAGLPALEFHRRLEKLEAVLATGEFRLLSDQEVNRSGRFAVGEDPVGGLGGGGNQ